MTTADDQLPSRRQALAVLGGAALLAACGGKSKESPPPSTVPSTTAAPAPVTVPPPPVFPLTGMPADPARSGRPAMTVKIDNAPQARPQSGIDVADLIYEEVVEGGVVRFAAVFHSTDAGTIGPVRSVRAEDALIVTPLRGYFVYSGGSEFFNDIIRKAPVGLVSEDDGPAGLLSRRRGRPSPYNLYTSTGIIYDKAPKRNEVPPPFASYRPAGQPLGGGASPTRELQVTMGERTTTAWNYDDASGRWLRTTNGTPHVVEGGNRLAFTNVVIQFCRYQGTGVKDQSGTTSPEAIVLGDGDVWVLSGPALAKGRWAKPDAGAVTRFTDGGGQPLALQPGPTWICLAPAGTPTVVR